MTVGLATACWGVDGARQERIVFHCRTQLAFLIILAIATNILTVLLATMSRVAHGVLKDKLAKTFNTQLVPFSPTLAQLAVLIQVVRLAPFKQIANGV